jgi:hypothetical protein
MRQVFLLGCTSLLALVLVAGRPLEKKWWKGNTHTHTLWSDGDAPPEWVADWYKTNGYHFLVLSDHNILSEGEKWVRIGEGKREFLPSRLKRVSEKFGAASLELRERNGARELRLFTLAELRKRFDDPGRFLFIQGEEITDEWKKVPIHHNSINQANVIPPAGGTSIRDVMQKTLAAVKAEAERSGRPVLAHLNHPNWKWAVSPDDVAHVLEERYFEVFDGAADSANEGDAAHPSTEEMWDHVLALRLGRLGGEPLYGLATDDSHEYFKDKAPSSPGRGWVMVRAGSLDADAITRAMLAGDFYASSGVTLREIEAGSDRLTVKAEPAEGAGYVIRFQGTRTDLKKVGEVLQETEGPEATYRFKGDELYVRATVVSSRRPANPYGKSDLETAWVQPVVVKRPPK